MRRKIPVIVVLVFAYMVVAFSQGIFSVEAQDKATPEPTPVVERRTEITISDPDAAPENLTSKKDGTVYFGSLTTGIIFRALPGVPQAEEWIPADKGGLTRVFGVLADEVSNTLWVCANVPTDSTDEKLTPAVLAYDLETGKSKGAYPFPDGGLCNDFAVAADGTLYASDTDGGRIFRLQPDAEALDIWVDNPDEIGGVDGLSVLEDGALYFNNYYNGTLSRIPVTDNGDAGDIEELELSAPIENPDGLRPLGPNTLLQAEGNGQVTEITIDGDQAEVRVLQDELSMPTGVTVVGNTAFVLVDLYNAVAVPITPAR